jgi:hypothetical protein
VLVSQDEPKIQRFERNEDGTWTLTPVTGMDQSLRLKSMEVELSLAEVFDRVDFSTNEAEEVPA